LREALRMYQLAAPHFPHNEKLAGKIAALKERVHAKAWEVLRESMLPNLPLGGEWGFSSQAFA
jgi:hypothetical protein